MYVHHQSTPEGESECPMELVEDEVTIDWARVDCPSCLDRRVKKAPMDDMAIDVREEA